MIIPPFHSKYVVLRFQKGLTCDFPGAEGQHCSQYYCVLEAVLAFPGAVTEGHPPPGLLHVRLGQASVPSSLLLAQQGHKRVTPQSSLHRQDGDLAPSPTQDHLQPTRLLPMHLCFFKVPWHWGGGSRAGQEAGSKAWPWVESGGGVVFGLSWKGQAQMGRQGGGLCALKGAWLRSSLVAVQSLQGEGGICILPSISGLNWW